MGAHECEVDGRLLGLAGGEGTTTLIGNDRRGKLGG